MERKKAVWIGALGFVIFISLLVAIFGDNPKEAAEKQNLLTEQVQPQSGMGESGEQSNCPKQGLFQPDWYYCVDLCMFDKEEGASSRACEQVCDSVDRLDGSYGTEHMDKRIQSFKCTKCGECTEEQLKEIEKKNMEEAKKQKETEVYDSCFSKCKEETQTLKECQNECATANRICDDCMVKINECIDDCKSNQ